MVVVAAIDRSNRAPAVVREAKSLADAFEDRLEVVHVMTESEFRDLEFEAYNEMRQSVPMDQVKAVAAEHAAGVASTVTSDYEAVGLVGDPAQMITNHVKNNPVRFVVVGPRRRSPTGKAMFGSVAQKVLLNVDCPVLSIVTDAEE